MPPLLLAMINRLVDLLAVPMVLFDYYADSNKHDNPDVVEPIDVVGGPWVPWMRSTGRPQRGNPPQQPRGPMRSEPRCSMMTGPMGPKPHQYFLLLYNRCTTLIFLPLDNLQIVDLKFFHNHL